MPPVRISSPFSGEIIFISDLHFRREFPFSTRDALWVEWFKTEFKDRRGVTFIFLGDVFHRSTENGDVNGLVVSLFLFIHEIGCDAIVLQGNHDFKKEDGSALNALKGVPGVQIVDSPVMFRDLWLVPWIYPRTELPDGRYVSTMMDFIQPKNLFPEEVEAKTLVGHFGDETCGAYAFQADLSWYSGRRVLGDIHKRVSLSYPGASQITRRDEAGRKCYYTTLVGEDYTYHDMPVFLDYVTVSFGTLPKAVEGKVLVVDVTSAPGEAEARRFYEERCSSPWLVFDQFEKETSSVYLGKTISQASSTAPISQLMEDFLTTKQTPRAVASRVKEAFGVT